MRAVAWPVLLLLIVSAPGPTYTPAPRASQSADDLRDLANKAKDTGDLLSSTSFICQAAIRDDRYAKRCEKSRVDLERALAQYQADLNMGRTEIERKDYGGAIRDLSRITFGPNKDEALELLQQARVGSGQISPEAASQMTLAAAQAAYEAGNFDRAEALLKRVQTPGVRYAANQILTNMSVYRDTMKQADTLAHNGDYKDAAAKYGFASAIQPKGPGQPQQRLRDAQDAELRLESAKEQQMASQRLQEQQAAATKVKLGTLQSPFQAQMNDASKIKTSLAVAQKFESAGQLKAALEAYEAVLKLDARQKVALTGKQRLSAVVKTDPRTVEHLLIQGVTDFYASRFQQANNGFHSYLSGGGKQHCAAAHFFFGASLLSQAMLDDPADTDNLNKLRQQAQQEFVAARQQHYLAPETFISPKIMAEWSRTGAQP